MDGRRWPLRPPRSEYNGCPEVARSAVGLVLPSRTRWRHSRCTRAADLLPAIFGSPGQQRTFGKGKARYGGKAEFVTGARTSVAAWLMIPETKSSWGGLVPKAQSAVMFGKMAGDGFASNRPYESRGYAPLAPIATAFCNAITKSRSTRLFRRVENRLDKALLAPSICGPIRNLSVDETTLLLDIQCDQLWICSQSITERPHHLHVGAPLRNEMNVNSKHRAIEREAAFAHRPMIGMFHSS